MPDGGRGGTTKGIGNEPMTRTVTRWVRPSPRRILLFPIVCEPCTPKIFDTAPPVSCVEATDNNPKNETRTRGAGVAVSCCPLSSHRPQSYPAPQCPLGGIKISGARRPNTQQPPTTRRRDGRSAGRARPARRTYTSPQASRLGSALAPVCRR